MGGAIMEVAVQTIVWGEARSNDLARVLREAAQAGYAGIELRPPENQQAAADMIKENGLRLAASHTNITNVERDVENQLRWLALNDAHILACSGPDFATSAQIRERAAALDRAGQVCRQHGVTLCYHNHAHEIHHDMFVLGHLLRATDPANVKLCPDTYWLERGGQDAPSLLRLLGDRVAYVHLKDMAADGGFAEVGQGRLDWAAIRAVLLELHLPWCAVEQDNTKRTPLESSQLSRTYIREHWGL